MNLRKSKNHEGFTLVELIVVIAIMAILAGVAVPVYSGYIEKANKAADLQLLGAVNSAFAAAVVENGSTNQNLTGASATVDTNGRISAVAASADGVDLTKVDESFDRYFAGNTESAFKVIKGLGFDTENYVFVDIASAEGDIMVGYNGNYITVSAADIKALNNSEFVQIGMESLVGKVDFATTIAGMMANNDDGDGIYSAKFDALINGDANKAALAAFLKVDSLDSEEYFNLLSEKATLIAKQNGESLDDPNVMYKYMDQAEQELLTSNAVLVAATNYGYISDDFVTALSNGTAKQTIVSNIADNPADAIAQAGFAYAMYTSYASKNNITVSEEMSLDDVYKALESKEFQDYMASSSTEDVAGYEAAMNMINSASGDKDTVSDLLVNGYTDPNLLAMLNQLTSTK